MSRKSNNLKKRLLIEKARIGKMSRQVRTLERDRDSLRRIIQGFERLRRVDMTLCRDYQSQTWGIQYAIDERIIFELSRRRGLLSDKRDEAWDIASDVLRHLVGKLARAIETGQITTYESADV